MVSQCLSWWLLLLCAVSSDTPIRVDGCSAIDPIISNIISSQSVSMESIGAERKETRSSARACVGKRKNERAESWDRASAASYWGHTYTYHPLKRHLLKSLSHGPKSYSLSLAFPFYRDRATRNAVEWGALKFNQLRSCFRTMNFNASGFDSILLATLTVSPVPKTSKHSKEIPEWKKLCNMIDKMIEHEQYKKSAKTKYANLARKRLNKKLALAI